MKLDYTQTIEEAQKVYTREERTRLGHIISFLTWEVAEDLEDAKDMAREVYKHAQCKRIKRGQTPLPDLKYFGL